LNFSNSIIKRLTYGHSRCSGRNFNGRITIRHRGGSVKRKIRLIDYWRIFCNIPAIVLIPQIYDPLKTIYLSLILYKNGVFSFISKPRFLECGHIIFFTSKKLFHIIGNSYPLRIIPEGLYLNSVTLHNTAKFVFAKSAGAYTFVISKHSIIGNKVLVKLPSQEEYLLNCNNICQLGRMDNIIHRNKRFKKAGQRRWKGKRPYVRGVAMNPVDHPHGGNTSIGRQHLSIWARNYAKGGATRKKDFNLKIIFHRRNLFKKKNDTVFLEIKI